MKRILLAFVLLVGGLASAPAQDWYNAPYAGSITRTDNSKNADIVSVFDFIPVSLQPAIKAGTSTTDVSSYLTTMHAAVPAGVPFLFPAGQYNIGAGSVALSGRTISIQGVTFTGGGSITGALALPLSSIAANTMLGNWTGSNAAVQPNVMPSCPDSGGNHLNYVSGTGITCGTGMGSAFVGDSGSGGANGLVPAPAAGDAAAGKVLGAGGGWVTVASGSGNLSSLLYDVTANGLVGNAKVVTDGAMASGSTTLTSATASFTANDVSKTISVEGAAAAGATLNTTIASFTNSTTVVLTSGNASGGAISGKQVTYGTDNTSAMSSLVTTVANADGGTILFPAGWYLFTGSIDLSTKTNITLAGVANATTTQFLISRGPPSRIIYTGTGSSNVIKLNDAFGHVVRNLWLSYSSSGYSGRYIGVNNTGTRDPQFMIIERNLFYSGSSSRNSNAFWVDLDKADQIRVVENSFEGGSQAISLRSAAGYANAINIDRNMFARQTSTMISGGGLAVTLIGNTFENLSGGTQGALTMGSTTPAQGWKISGNWFGDATVAGGIWLTLFGQGIDISGNTFVGSSAASGNYAISLNNVKGFSIIGNRFDTLTNCIDYSTATVDGGLVSGNARTNTTNLEGATGNKGANVINTGNTTF